MFGSWARQRWRLGWFELFIILKGCYSGSPKINHFTHQRISLSIVTVRTIYENVPVDSRPALSLFSIDSATPHDCILCGVQKRRCRESHRQRRSSMSPIKRNVCFPQSLPWTPRWKPVLLRSVSACKRLCGVAASTEVTLLRARSWHGCRKKRERKKEACAER